MLPTVLSDTLCSLQENQNRFALAMDIYIDMEGNFLEDIEAVKYRNVLIKVLKIIHMKNINCYLMKRFTQNYMI